MTEKRIDQPEPPLDLARKTYLSVDQAMEYLSVPSRNAFYKRMKRQGSSSRYFGTDWTALETIMAMKS